MKFFKNLFNLLFIFYIIFSCNGQEKNKKLSLDTISNNLKIELNKRNDAFKNNDLKIIYYYSHPSEIKNQTFEDFEKDNIKYLEATKRDSLIIKRFEILKIGSIINCNSEYQSIIKLRTAMLMGKKEFSFDRNLIAFSKDGEKWTFINGGENNLKTIKKLYPFVCIDKEDE